MKKFILCITFGLLLLMMLSLTVTGHVAVASHSASVHHHTARIWVTGYVATGNPTNDGSTPSWGTAAIALYGSNLPYHRNIHVNKLGTFWTDDTGDLSSYGLDVYCNSTQQAYLITGWYNADWVS